MLVMIKVHNLFVLPSFSERSLGLLRQLSYELHTPNSKPLRYFPA